MYIRQLISLREYQAKTPEGTLQVHKDLLQLYFEAQVRANMVYLALTPKTPLLYSSGVTYEREGAPELWLDIPAIRRQGYDDCEGLSCWLAAEMRTRSPNSVGDKIRPAAMAVLKKTKRNGLWHALVIDKETGERFDPSRKLGMGTPENG
jgi:hypothetical protein